MICKGCGNDARLIKAHIIPKAFFMGLRDGGKPPLIISGVAGVYPKKAPIGEYDEQLLCRKCEDVFQELDDYGARVFLQKKKFKHTPFTVNGDVKYFQVDNVEFNLLKKFLISVIWRASISQRDFFSNIDLGCFEDELKDVLFDNKKLNPDEFSFFIVKFTGGKGKEKKAILDPHMTRVEGVNYCRVYMFGLVVLMKVDKRKSPQKFKKIEMIKTGTLKMLATDFEKSKEYLAMLHTVKKSIK